MLQKSHTHVNTIQQKRACVNESQTERQEWKIKRLSCWSIYAALWRQSGDAYLAAEKSFSKSYFEEEKESNQEIEPISDICFDEPKISHVLVHDPPNPRQ